MRSPGNYLLLFFVALLLILFIQIQIFSLVLSKLGLSPDSAALLLITTLFGSAVNLPLAKIKAQAPPEPPPQPQLPDYWPFKMPPFTGYTVIAINVGGAMVPILFSLYLFLSQPLPLPTVLLAIAIVSAISYGFSRPVAGLGIGMPIFIAPLTAAITALLLAPEHSPPLAYICGTLGVLIGADLLRLKDIPQLGTPIASIGGAGTFDGIFFTGIIAVLLA
ncbi:MAG: DUF1614 domain-containing protein [Thiohalophilus sp.]|uniref:DUF1614 domain-containing protein n=1 Tax=Thiohalophilus sp. TaxID=3028392 RepID=UPI00286FDE5C|nr:DUF1614 domain-containing protein [Thiohalophilus sp.]MDR9437285.1 DUF1614 domain-containing protein [Thiohalophilus sp.]